MNDLNMPDAAPMRFAEMRQIITKTAVRLKAELLWSLC